MGELEEILRSWNGILGATSVEVMPSDLSSVWEVTAADGRSYVLKRHGAPSGLDREYAVLEHLATKDVPVALPVRTDDGRPDKDGAFTLAPMLPTDAVPPEEVPGAYARIGRAFGALHRALATYPRRIETYAVELAGLPVQLIHGDLHSGNVLTAGGVVTGFVDFANLPYGPRIYDVARYLVDRVLWVIEEPDEREAAFLNGLGELVAGYDAVERAAIAPGMYAAATSVAAWLRETPGLPAGWADKGATAVRWIEHRQDELARRSTGTS